MSDPELRARGREIRRQLVGPEVADKLDREVYTDRHMEKFAEFGLEWLFAQHWTRPGLDLKTKTMVAMTADVATGAEDALGLHVRFCRRQGWSEDEIVEAILLAMAYVGVPKGRQAMIIARRVFDEMNGDGAPPEG